MRIMLVGMVLLSVGLGLEAYAAAQNTAPYATGKICWPWAKGAAPDNADADHLNVKCGTTQGGRNFTKPLPFPTTQPMPAEFCIAIKDVIPQPAVFPASFYCAATAGLGNAESKRESPELFFSVVGPEIAAPGPARLVP